MYADIFFDRRYKIARKILRTHMHVAGGFATAVLKEETFPGLANDLPVVVGLVQETSIRLRDTSEGTQPGSVALEDPFHVLDYMQGVAALNAAAPCLHWTNRSNLERIVAMYREHLESDMTPHREIAKVYAMATFLDHMILAGGSLWNEAKELMEEEGELESAKRLLLSELGHAIVDGCREYLIPCMCRKGETVIPPSYLLNLVSICLRDDGPREKLRAMADEFLGDYTELDLPMLAIVPGLIGAFTRLSSVLFCGVELSSPNRYPFKVKPDASLFSMTTETAAHLASRLKFIDEKVTDWVSRFVNEEKFTNLPAMPEVDLAGVDQAIFDAIEPEYREKLVTPKGSTSVVITTLAVIRWAEEVGRALKTG